MAEILLQLALNTNQSINTEKCPVLYQVGDTGLCQTPPAVQNDLF